MRLVGTISLMLVLVTSARLDAQLRIVRADVEGTLTTKAVTVFDATVTPDARFNLGTSGAGNTWDLRTFTFTPTVYNRTFVAPSSTPYTDDFPGATHAMVSQGDQPAFLYFKLNDVGLYSLGVGTEMQGVPYIQKNVPDMPDFLFPMQLGSKWSYTSDVNEPFPGFTQVTTQQVEVVASGTLITSRGSGDALCIKNVTRTSQRIVVGGQVFSEDYQTSVDFMLVTKDGYGASLTIDTNDIASNNPRITDLSFSVEGAVNSVHAAAAVQPLSIEAVWPNPLAQGDMLHVRWAQQASEQVELSIIDLQGRVVARQYAGRRESGANSSTVRVGQLPAGMYLLRVHGGGVAAERMIGIMR